MGYEDITYESAGVSIKAQNSTNAEVIRRLNNQGMRADGLFSGSVNISTFKGKKIKLELGISGVIKDITYKYSGEKTANAAFNGVFGTPVAVLDYFASSNMGSFVADFVEGVALSAKAHNCAVIGGESAQMPNTYINDEFDAFVHVLSIDSENKGNGLDISDLINGMEKPILAATTDGTGTKTKIIKNPADIIFHGFNDLSTQGIRPLAVGLYISGNSNPQEFAEIETLAEKISKSWGVHKFTSGQYFRDSVYRFGEIDIAGTVIGIVDAKNVITKDRVRDGDIIIGISTDGLMTNGYSLARKFASQYCLDNNLTMDSKIDALGAESFNQALSKPHRPVTDILFGNRLHEGIVSKYSSNIHGMAHITGGGQEDNIPRMIPDPYGALIIKDVLPVPPIMEFMRQKGINEETLYSTFNMGPGFVIAVDKTKANEIVNYINSNFKYGIEGFVRSVSQIGVVKELDYQNGSIRKFEFSK